MYVDTDFNTLLPSLPNAYKYTSNFDYLSEEELKLFNVYKVESFVEDDAYQDLLAVLGTEFYTQLSISVQCDPASPGVGVQVLLDRDTAISKIKELTGQTDDYATVQDAILNKPVYVPEPPAPVVPDVYVYDYANSYVFVVLGDPELTLVNPNPDIESPTMARFKYVLHNDDPDQMPAISIGDTLTQSGGFSGVVTFIDPVAKVIKLELCTGIDVLDRTAPLLQGTTAVGNVFCYELYLKVLSLNDTEWVPPEDYPEILGANKVTIKVVHTCPALTYTDNYKWFVTDDETTTVKIQMASCDLSMTNVRSMTSYGRYA